MKFEFQLLKYVIVIIIGAVYFGIVVPVLISYKGDISSSSGIALLIFGIAGIILFVRSEINLYYKNVYEKGIKNEKGDELDGSKHETNDNSN